MTWIALDFNERGRRSPAQPYFSFLFCRLYAFR